MENYLNGIDEHLWRCITNGNYHPLMLEQVGTAGSYADVVVRTEKQEANDNKCLHELHGALPLVVYNYI